MFTSTKRRRQAPSHRKKNIAEVLWIIFVTALFGVLSFPASEGAEKGTPLEYYTSCMEERVPALMKHYGIPGASLALVMDGSLVWSQAYGHADVEKNRRMTTDTPMRVQSISKPVTAWGVVRLAEEGRIDLDKPVVQYIKKWHFPDSAFPGEKVTVRQLLCHTSGMPLGDVFDMYRPDESIPSLEESLAKSAVLTREPGSAFSYSNAGYNLLELLIEEATGRDFSEYMAGEVLLPLGMSRSSFLWSETMSPPVPTGYNLSGDAVPVYVYPEKGSGGLFATAEDIAAFAIAGMPDFSDNPVLSRQGVEDLFMPRAEDLGIYSLVFDSYGEGYYLQRLPGGALTVAHGGQGAGLMTHFQAVPETGDAIVILTNSQRSWPFIALLLRDWAQWRGFPSMGMERILWAQSALWALSGLIFALVLLQSARLATGVLRGNLRFTLRFQEMTLRRLMLLGAAFLLLAGLIWCLCQRYLFLSSVFPIASVWLEAAAGALSGVLLASALFLKKDDISC